MLLRRAGRRLPLSFLPLVLPLRLFPLHWRLMAGVLRPLRRNQPVAARLRLRLRLRLRMRLPLQWQLWLRPRRLAGGPAGHCGFRRRHAIALAAAETSFHHGRVRHAGNYLRKAWQHAGAQ